MNVIKAVRESKGTQNKRNSQFFWCDIRFYVSHFGCAPEGGSFIIIFLLRVLWIEKWVFTIK